MTAAVVLMLVAGDAVVKSDFAGQSAFGEQLQSAIDGSVADAGILLLNQAVELVGGKMVAGLKKGAENRVTLGSLLEANTLQVAMKNVLGLADHLAGQGRLIVDAFLKHESQRSGSGYHRSKLKMKFNFSIARARLAYNQSFP